MAYPRQTNVDFGMGTFPAGRHGNAQGINDMLVCTYNESHLVSAGRYFSHIEECRKAFEANGGDTSTILKCPFRSSHHVAASVMDKHIQMCDGYYEWHMENQKEPPSMADRHPHIDTGEEASGAAGGASGSGAIPNLTDYTIPRTISDSDSFTDSDATLTDTEVQSSSETSTTESFVSARGYFSDESHTE